MLIIHQSNQLEVLFAALGEVITPPLANVFSPETIIVQSQGMARWLSLRISVEHGVCANLDCPFPAAYLWRLFALGDDVEESQPPYDPAAMIWAIMEILELEKDDPVFAPVTNYWQRQGAELRRYQLAVELADLFDCYMVQRPDWIRKWSQEELDFSGMENGHLVWQVKLWRTLFMRHGGVHRVALFDRFLHDLSPALLATSGVPERLSLFGIPSMPQGQMDIFAALAQYIDVHIFTLAPCQEFWLDMVSKKTKLRAEAKADYSSGVDDSQFMDVGCQLLVGLGGLGRSFQHLLLGYDEVDDRSIFVEPGADNVLNALQSDILDGWPVSGGHDLAAADNSVQIIAAHSAMREVEILADFLKEELNSNPDLEAADILVMMPDISRYAPLVEAVFSTGDVTLPYSIADRRQGGLLIRSFVDLLVLASSRFELSAVLDFLALLPVRQGWDISAHELQTIKTWLRESGVRWALDETHRQGFAVPASRHATWRQGLDRMLLGVALPGHELFNGLLPYDSIEGGNAETLSKLLDFFDLLSRFVDGTRGKRTLEEWADLLGAGLDDFFDEDESWLPQRRNIRTVLDKLSRNQQAAGSEESVSLVVVTAALKKELDSPGGGGNFLCGRITFCQLVPMRTIPFKVICLLGMNTVGFPRQDRPLGFDLMAAEPRVGDRSRREDDRYLFLETILAARKTLYLSYLGVSDRDNRPMPPSVVISEVMEHLASRYSLTPKQAKGRFVTVHPLQPFSRRYFNGQLSTYSSIYHEIAEKIGSDDRKGIFAADYTLPPVAAECLEISLDDFTEFFKHPVRYLFRRNLGMFLDEYYDDISDRECFALNSLDKYKLVSHLIDQALKGDFAADYSEIVRQQTMIPEGELGSLFYAGCREDAKCLAQRIDDLGAGAKRTVEVDLIIGRGRVRGRVNLLGDKLVFYRPGQRKNYSCKDLISSWIPHLFLCASCPDSDITTNYLFLDGGLMFERQAEAVAQLEEMMNLFVVGQSWPLPFFPRASMKYAQAMLKKGTDEDIALQRAMACWLDDNFYNSPEKNDPYFTAAYGDDIPLGSRGDYSFTEVAATVLAEALLQGQKI